MPKLHILSTKNSDKQQVEQGIYLIMERFRKLPNYWIGANSSWKSVSYACLFLCCWIIVDIQISSSIFLEKGFSKDQDGKCILNQSRYSKCYRKILTPSQTTVRSFSSTPIHSRCMYWQPQKTLGMTLTAARCKKIQLEKPGVSRGCLQGFISEKISMYLGSHTNYLPFQKPKTFYFTFSKYLQ